MKGAGACFVCWALGTFIVLVVFGIGWLGFLMYQYATWVGIL